MKYTEKRAEIIRESPNEAKITKREPKITSGYKKIILVPVIKFWMKYNRAIPSHKCCPQN